ncbi:hypothetical protein KR044_008641, partial [Drosophila immigrans]
VLTAKAKVFASPNESLPYNTAVVATIRTTNESPIYTKLYPYPMGLADFVAKEMEQILKDGIIRKSRSPYNNPLWVVDKKGVDEFGEKKKRLVVDFRKLNEQTIADKYPMPDISMILANLGKENYVADALSRLNVNALEDQFSRSDAATVHSEASLSCTIESVDNPLNCFRNQIVIKEARFPSTQRFVIFKTKMRHLISFTNKEALLDVLKEVVNPDVVNALHCSLHVLAQIQNELVTACPATKFRYC